jgi:hypothetical protein
MILYARNITCIILCRSSCGLLRAWMLMVWILFSSALTLWVFGYGARLEAFSQREVLLTVLHFFSNILSWVHVWAVSWPFQHFGIVTLEVVITAMSAWHGAASCMKMPSFCGNHSFVLERGSCPERLWTILSALPHLQHVMDPYISKKSHSRQWFCQGI